MDKNGAPRRCQECEEDNRMYYCEYHYKAICDACYEEDHCEPECEVKEYPDVSKFVFQINNMQKVLNCMDTCQDLIQNLNKRRYNMVMDEAKQALETLQDKLRSKNPENVFSLEKDIKGLQRFIDESPNFVRMYRTVFQEIASRHAKSTYFDREVFYSINLTIDDIGSAGLNKLKERILEEMRYLYGKELKSKDRKLMGLQNEVKDLDNSIESLHRRIQKLEKEQYNLVKKYEGEIDDLKKAHFKEKKDLSDKYNNQVFRQIHDLRDDFRSISDSVISRSVQPFNTGFGMENVTQSILTMPEVMDSRSILSTQHQNKSLIKYSSELSLDDFEEEKDCSFPNNEEPLFEFDKPQPAAHNVEIKIDKSGKIVGDVQRYMLLKKIDHLKISGLKLISSNSESHNEDPDSWNLSLSTITMIKTLVNICTSLQICGIALKEDILLELLKECVNVQEVIMDRVSIADMGLSEKPINYQIQIEKITFKRMNGIEMKCFKPILKISNTKDIEIISCRNISPDLISNTFSDKNVRISDEASEMSP